MGLDATKPVFGVSDKASFKPVSSATETSKKIEISLVASLHRVLSQKRITKMLIRLVCACVVSKLPKTGFLTSRPMYFNAFHKNKIPTNISEFIVWVFSHTVGPHKFKVRGTRDFISKYRKFEL